MTLRTIRGFLFENSKSELNGQSIFRKLYNLLRKAKGTAAESGPWRRSKVK